MREVNDMDALLIFAVVVASIPLLIIIFVIVDTVLM